MYAPPPLENWMIMGAFAFFAASRHELMMGDIVQFTAGMAYPLARAWFSTAR